MMPLLIAPDSNLVIGHFERTTRAWHDETRFGRLGLSARDPIGKFEATMESGVEHDQHRERAMMPLLIDRRRIDTMLAAMATSPTGRPIQGPTPALRPMSGNPNGISR